jgi:hypothetical protein
MWEGLDVSRSREGGVFFAGEDTYAALQAAWRAKPGGATGVQIDRDSWGRHPKIDADIRWTGSGYIETYDAYNPYPPNAQDLIGQFGQYNDYDVLSVSGLKLYTIGYHMEQFR